MGIGSGWGILCKMSWICWIPGTTVRIGWYVQSVFCCNKLTASWCCILKSWKCWHSKKGCVRVSCWWHKGHFDSCVLSHFALISSVWNPPNKFNAKMAWSASFREQWEFRLWHLWWINQPLLDHIPLSEMKGFIFGRKLRENQWVFIISETPEKYKAGYFSGGVRYGRLVE